MKDRLLVVAASGEVLEGARIFPHEVASNERGAKRERGARSSNDPISFPNEVSYVPHPLAYFATQWLEGGYDIRTVQELCCHSDVKTTIMYIHVLNRGPANVCSPVDEL